MGTHDLFEPALRAYLGYFLEVCVRYFAIAGGAYWILHRRYKSTWSAYRVQEMFPGSAEIGHEIRWSMSNMACSGVSTLLMYHLINNGRTSMYFGIAEYGWMYLGISAVLCVIGYDTWIYWQHRSLHTPWLFRHVHSVHHRIGNPTAFATFASHPVETFMGNIYFILFVLHVPIHPVALGAAGLFMFMTGVIAHSGYEFYPRAFARHPWLAWFNTATYHNMHHSLVGYHFSPWFAWWDRLMGTYHPDYPKTFDAIKNRVEATRTIDHSGTMRRAA